MSDQDFVEFHTAELRSLSAAELETLGKGYVGYIRAFETDDGVEYELYAADGNSLATASTVDAALFAAEHLNLEPVTLH